MHCILYTHKRTHARTHIQHAYIYTALSLVALVLQGRVGRVGGEGKAGRTEAAPLDRRRTCTPKGGGGPTWPVLAAIHPFPLGPPKVGTTSQRRQGTA